MRFACLPVLVLFWFAPHPVLAAPTVGVFADVEATRNVVATVPFQTFDLYVVAKGTQLDAFELDLEFSPGITAFSVEVLDRPPIGIPQDPDAGIFQVLASCYPDQTQLVRVTVGLFDLAHQTDQTVCLGPHTPSSVTPAAPAYRDCAGAFVPFQFASGPNPELLGCTVLNPVNTVDTESTSFGTVKARY